MRGSRPEPWASHSSRNLRHFDWNGRLAPTNLASDAEIFAVAGVVDEVGRGHPIWRRPEAWRTSCQGQPVPGLLRQHYPADGRPDRWREQLTQAENMMRQGHRAYHS